MATLCETYLTIAKARRVAAGLHAAGVPEHDIGVIAGSDYHDVRAEGVGGFGGQVDPDAPFGKYAGPARRRWQAAGGFSGMPDRQRQGSFADVEGDLSISYDRGGEHTRLTGDAMARRLLTRANVPGDVAERVVDELHHGHAVMLAEVSELDPRTVEALVHEPAEAA
jgi:hypothetical protein